MAASRRRIESRMRSARGLRDIVHSMRSLAAVNIRRAEDSLATIRDYHALVVDLFRLSVPLLPRGWRWGALKGAPVVFIFSSDLGLSGAFNERVVEFALAEAARLGEGTRLAIIGARGEGLLRERGVQPLLFESAPRTLAGIEDTMRRLASRVLQLFAAAGSGSLHLAYNRYASVGSFTPVRDQVLPPPLARLLAPKEGRALPQTARLYSRPESVVEQLIEEYLFIEMYRALAESLASENGARLRAMDEAMHNIDQTIDRLTLELRVSRQEEITSEILDLVGGAEALRPRR